MLNHNAKNLKFRDKLTGTGGTDRQTAKKFDWIYNSLWNG